MVKFKNHDFSFDSRNKKARTGFFTPKARLTFTQWRQVFVKTPILYYFNLKSYIRIEIDALNYAIGSILSQLTSKTRPDGVVIKTNLSQWHLIAFLSRKIILAEIWYEIYNGKLLAIVKAFKIWQYYLKSYKYKVFILIDYNNLCHFINTKSLNFRQVCWAQKLFCYHFYIDYWQDKNNKVADAIFQYL